MLLYSGAGQSVRHHMLTNYMYAILSVVLAQFTGLGFLDGMEGVIKLAEASPYVQVHWLDQVWYELSNICILLAKQVVCCASSPVVCCQVNMQQHTDICVAVQ